MGASDWVAIGLAVVTLLFGLIGWSLNRQIAQGEKEHEAEKARIDEAIRLLFKKHDDDAAKLQELREMVLSQHYRREELDIKFKELESTFKGGFEDMGAKLDELTKSMISHIGEHTGVYRSGSKL